MHFGLVLLLIIGVSVVVAVGTFCENIGYGELGLIDGVCGVEGLIVPVNVGNINGVVFVLLVVVVTVACVDVEFDGQALSAAAAVELQI